MRKSIVLILENKYELKDMKNICMEQFNIYNYKNDLVWIYIATNEENYIIGNWILRMLWISPKLDERINAIRLSQILEKNIYFEYNESYYKLEKYYRDNIFKNDRFLFINNFKLYYELKHIYGKILKEYENENYVEILKISKKHKNKIEEVYSKYSNIGVSSNIEFEDYLQEFQSYMALMHNIASYASDESRDVINKEYLVKINIERIKVIIDKIDKGRNYWINRLDITTI